MWSISYPRVSALVQPPSLGSSLPINLRKLLGPAQRVHQQWPDIELIVTSGTSNIGDVDLPDHGIFLRKPYRADQLTQIVEKSFDADLDGSPGQPSAAASLLPYGAGYHPARNTIPHAILSPLPPLGSVFSSSGLA